MYRIVRWVYRCSPTPSTDLPCLYTVPIFLCKIWCDDTLPMLSWLAIYFLQCHSVILVDKNHNIGYHCRGHSLSGPPWPRLVPHACPVKPSCKWLNGMGCAGFRKTFLQSLKNVARFSSCKSRHFITDLCSSSLECMVALTSTLFKCSNLCAYTLLIENKLTDL